MPATLMPKTRTTYTQKEMIKAFIEGWKELFGSYPKKESVAVLWSQSAVETGSTTSMWNNNIGNVKYMPSKDPDPEADNHIQYMMLNGVWEILNGQKVIFEPPHPATWFRSFPTVADGFAFHINFLKNKKSYKAAWAAVEAGDPVDFSRKLKAAWYYTAPEADYTKLLKFHFDKFMKDKGFEEMLAEIQKEPETTVLEKVSELFFKKD